MGKLDGRIIRVELDAGFKPGRQYGRGSSGGQVRDDRRGVIDPERVTRNKSGALNSRRWQAPQRTNEQYGPPTYMSGQKRMRDDDQDLCNYGRAAKNSRFDEGSDEDI